MTSYFLRTLFVHTAGTRLVLDGDAVRALRDEAPPRRLPLNAIDSIAVLSGIDVSTPLLTRCAEDGRTIAILSRYGKPRAIIEGPTSGRGRLRRLQYESHFDTSRRDALARSIVAGKIRQMAWALKQWARDAEATAATQLQQAAAALQQDHASLADIGRLQALGVEGAASRRYFECFPVALKVGDFPGRQRRPPPDPVNAVLSFLYSMTRLAVHGATHAAGLDPYCGFLHGDRDGQPSLVLDLMEEFRPEADRLTVSLFNRRQPRDEHFETSLTGAVSLTDVGREIVMNAWHQHRKQETRLRSAQMLVPNAAIPILQANLLANSLRSRSSYTAHELVVR
ncbi:CRISPR-associated endonuclease Cas1 [Nocardioides sp. L-11A]|uniref:CRISPR-associated endonuclease Cas1 n=1 Tax=Nocardioides sp. L-11A TaxID=3043848 RepID=UPI00249AFBF8|nr:CRISPR-associated endonuclease Cas1 [Nocardioides sp. L-11A]